MEEPMPGWRQSPAPPLGCCGGIIPSALCLLPRRPVFYEAGLGD